jgi:TolB protein
MSLLRPVSRRAFFYGAAALAAGARRAFAGSDVYVHAGANFTPVNIAVTQLQGDVGDAKIGAIIVNDLSRSVFLAPLDPQSFPEAVANPDTKPNLDAWKTINAQFVLTGKVGKLDGGRITAQFRLWDVLSGEQVAGQQYSTEATNSRRVAHLIADAVFSRVTGETGFFDSRVVFVDETGPKANRRKRLALMDTDGANIKYLTQGEKLVVTPRFSPSQQEIAYMSFAEGDPRVTLLDLETGQRTPVGEFSGMTFSPRFSPDGRKLLLCLSGGANANIYLMDLASHSQTQLTDGSAIDASPCFSPDGSQIVFESDRGGAQQLYVMSASGGPAKRISFGSGRYSTPVWSPRGDLIAFTRQRDNLFGIGVMKPDGSGERIITEGFHNEGPTFSPNGLFLMFFRDPGGESGAKIYMADIFGHGEFLVPTPSYASDPSWGPLLR